MKSRFAKYTVMGSDGHNPTLYVDVAAGATKSLADELEEWTRRVVKTGEGTLVASPGTAVTSMQIEGGTLKLGLGRPLGLSSRTSGLLLTESGQLFHDLTDRHRGVLFLGGGDSHLSGINLGQDGQSEINRRNIGQLTGHSIYLFQKIYLPDSKAF
jgi:hypothetical protein